MKQQTKRNKQHNIRFLACQAVGPIVSQNEKSRSLDDQIEHYCIKIENHKDISLFKRLCYDLCRWQTKLTALSQLLLDKPLKKKDLDLQLAINIGLLQLFFLDIAPHAAIKESADIAKLLGKSWATALLNAVLRKAQRMGLDELEDQLSNSPSIISSHPEWLVKRIQSDWPSHFQTILRANNVPGPLTLRVNTHKLTRDHYLNVLQQRSIQATSTPLSVYGITLEKGCPIEEIPQFDVGAVSVQDEAAQLASYLLEVEDHQTILDACAAPGGKSAHILELAPNAKLIANDISASRLEKVVDNFTRLGITAETTQHDLNSPPFPHAHFDRILLDAPCSGTGVIRRHPDIKWLRRESDIGRLSKQQYTLLEHAWPLLKPGGKLLYCTCSILREENEQVIIRFTGCTPSAKVLPISLDSALDAQSGQYLLPSESGHDGFYYALLEKN